MRAAGAIVVVSAVLLLAACPQGPQYPASSWRAHAPEEGGAPGEPASTAEPETQPRSPEAEAMHAWFLAIGAAEHAVVRGDATAAREEGRELAEKLHGAAPPGAWLAVVSEITREADALAHAETLEAAGSSVARLAGHCGDCHASLGVEAALPALESMPPRRPARDPSMTMKWHGWAADRMWEGLVGPSDDRWVRGTATFVALPGCEAAQTRCESTRALAQRAHVAVTLEDRAAIYGTLLATCADCHVAASPPVVVPPRT